MIISPESYGLGGGRQTLDGAARIPTCCGYARSMSLEKYREKRPSGRSPEPRGRPRKRRGSAPHFVVQHHAASTDHYDFRLEIDGVLASWAVPKGPSVNPKDKRMARRTEDHPMDYEEIRSVIPEGEYGAWSRDRLGRTNTNEAEHDMAAALERGHLSFRLMAQKLHGGFALTRFRTGKDEAWPSVKKSDDDADGGSMKWSTESAPSGRTLDEVS